jgi:hypothetical protein
VCALIGEHEVRKYEYGVRKARVRACSRLIRERHRPEWPKAVVITVPAAAALLEVKVGPPSAEPVKAAIPLASAMTSHVAESP